MDLGRADAVRDAVRAALPQRGVGTLDSFVFLFPSQTFALKAKRMLNAEGMRAKVVKTGRTRSGCTYGVAVAQSDFYTAKQKLYASGIPFEYNAGGGAS